MLAARARSCGFRAPSAERSAPLRARRQEPFMHVLRIRALAAGLAALCLVAASPAGQAQMTPGQRRDEMGKLQCVRDGSHKLGESSSTISLPPEHAAAFAADAVRFETLL